MRSLIAGLAVAAAFAFGSTASVHAETLRFAHAAPENDLQQDLAVYFAKEVEKRTNGEITVQIFPQGQLGTDSAMIDGARSGIIDVVMSGLNNFTGLIPEAGAFTLPFLFSDRQEAYKVLDGKPGQTVLDRLGNFGLKGLGLPENGFRNMTNNRGPIKEPKDVAGLRMRVNSSKALNDMFQILDASPQQIPVAELYTALETGVVNAQDHPIGIVQSFKFYEVQKFLSMTRHAYAPLILAMNKNKFQGLSEKNQKIISEAAKDAIEMERKLSQESEEDILSKLKNEGMSINDDVDTAAFQKAIQPVYMTFKQENGDELLNQIQEAVKTNTSSSKGSEGSSSSDGTATGASQGSSSSKNGQATSGN